jgi:hypothetical protein
MHLRSNAAYAMVKITLMQDVLETQLRSHVVQTHKMADYRFQCEYCPKRLDTKQHMRNHVRFVRNIFFALKVIKKTLKVLNREVFDLLLFTELALILSLRVGDFGAGHFLLLFIIFGSGRRNLVF